MAEFSFSERAPVWLVTHVSSGGRALKEGADTGLYLFGQKLWFLNHVELYPTLFLIALVVGVILGLSLRFLVRGRLVSLASMWLLLLVGAAMSYGHVFNADLKYQAAHANRTPPPFEGPDLSGLVELVGGANLATFIVLGVAGLLIFLISKVRRFLVPDLGSRLSLEGFIVSLCAMLVFILMNVGEDTAYLGYYDQTAYQAGYVYMAWVVVLWLGHAVFYRLLELVLQTRYSRTLAVLQIISLAVALILINLPQMSAYAEQQASGYMVLNMQPGVMDALTRYGYMALVGSLGLLSTTIIHALLQNKKN